MKTKKLVLSDERKHTSTGTEQKQKHKSIAMP